MKYAAIGDEYDEENDWFKPVQPDPSFTWDEETWSWVDPNPPTTPAE
jgi:hypothetical protein